MILSVNLFMIYYHMIVKVERVVNIYDLSFIHLLNCSI